MQHLTYSTLQIAARFLSAKTGDDWTPELILDRLRILLNNHCEGLGLETVRVLLPAGWQVQDDLTGEHFHFSRPTLLELSQAGDFVDQLCTFGDSATAVGRPLAVTMGTRRLHSMDLIPASALRLVPGDLAALANLPKPETITPYWDLVAGIEAGRYPELAEELESFGVARPDEDEELHPAPAAEDGPPKAPIATRQAEVTLPTEPQEARIQPTEDDADAELAALFDPVKVATLEAMFPDKKWGRYAEKAPRNGLNRARVGRGIFNPYLAARWWLHRQAPADWKWERCVRVLANNLPARSRDSKHLLTGGFD